MALNGTPHARTTTGEGIQKCDKQQFDKCVGANWHSTCQRANQTVFNCACATDMFRCFKVSATHYTTLHIPILHNTTHDTTQHNTHSTTQHCPTLHNTTQHNTTQPYNTLQQPCTTQHDPTLHCTTQNCTTLHSSTRHTTY